MSKTAKWCYVMSVTVPQIETFDNIVGMSSSTPQSNTTSNIGD